MIVPWLRIGVAVVAVASTLVLALTTLVVDPVVAAAGRGASAAAIEGALVRGLVLVCGTSGLALCGWLLWVGVLRRRHLARAVGSLRRLASGDYRRASGAGADGDPELERAIEHLRAGLERAVREQATAIAIVAHDLRSPLTGIGLAADRLARGGDPAAVARARAMVERESARIAALADEVLALCAEVADPRVAEGPPVGIGEILDDIAERVRAAHGRRVEVRGPRSLPVPAADAPDLARSIANLAENAARHVTDRGAVVLEARPTPTGGIAVAVEDDGCGLEAAAVAPFGQGGGVRGRAGLGLASVERAARRLGGELVVGRSASGGARVRLEVVGRGQRGGS